ncbi:hypothetical protein CLU79DRAFT_836883 [Phycomyces nitens]|nr:hypothetical protein CLU79DRAFT_836883 [Phycomyces nitens]
MKRLFKSRSSRKDLAGYESQRPSDSGDIIQNTTIPTDHTRQPLSTRLQTQFDQAAKDMPSKRISQHLGPPPLVMPKPVYAVPPTRDILRSYEADKTQIEPLAVTVRQRSRSGPLDEISIGPSELASLPGSTRRQSRTSLANSIDSLGSSRQAPDKNDLFFPKDTQEPPIASSVESNPIYESAVESPDSTDTNSSRLNSSTLSTQNPSLIIPDPSLFNSIHQPSPKMSNSTPSSSSIKSSDTLSATKYRSDRVRMLVGAKTRKSFSLSPEPFLLSAQITPDVLAVANDRQDHSQLRQIAVDQFQPDSIQLNKGPQEPRRTNQKGLRPEDTKPSPLEGFEDLQRQVEQMQQQREREQEEWKERETAHIVREQAMLDQINRTQEQLIKALAQNGIINSNTQPVPISETSSDPPLITNFPRQRPIPDNPSSQQSTPNNRSQRQPHQNIPRSRPNSGDRLAPDDPAMRRRPSQPSLRPQSRPNSAQDDYFTYQPYTDQEDDIRHQPISVGRRPPSRRTSERSLRDARPPERSPYYESPRDRPPPRQSNGSRQRRGNLFGGGSNQHRSRSVELVWDEVHYVDNPTPVEAGYSHHRFQGSQGRQRSRRSQSVERSVSSSRQYSNYPQRSHDNRYPTQNNPAYYPPYQPYGEYDTEYGFEAAYYSPTVPVLQPIYAEEEAWAAAHWPGPEFPIVAARDGYVRAPSMRPRSSSRREYQPRSRSTHYYRPELHDINSYN